ncbi:glycosyl hydrolase family 28-related protein [Peribacillus simplex]|uniref:glycosyl hydrolase family 28-related protein n=1 Tax=Peribacillus simplex TaxID=1478 RepID=UPI0011DE3B00|nr:glycosyl hydrolase family 28-related protein [Peribacillus simplex]
MVVTRFKKLTIAVLVVGVFLAIIFTKIINPTDEDKKKTDAVNVNVQDFKVVADDTIDDTKQIQEAIDYVSNKGGGVVNFPRGKYLINALKSIQLRDNITLKFKNGSTLKALPNEADGYEILRIHDVKNVSILGKVKIVGERNEHLGKTGEWGMGISIKGAEDVRVEYSIIQDCWGDGLYVGKTEKKNFSKNITIKNVELQNNRRQGISVISAINLSIISPVISNTNGTAPGSGIDLEPNHPSEYLQNIKIVNASTNSNEGYGLLFAIGRLTESKNPVDIEVINTKKIEDDIGIFIPNRIKGKIKIGNEYVLRNL